MYSKFLLLLICFSILTAFSQEDQPNLSFETFENAKPVGWDNFGDGDYSYSVDETTAQDGSVSATIESNSKNGQFWAYGLTIPATFGGKTIKLTGYLKTENVTGGYAGLWMRIDPQVAFDNMNDRGVTGTTDWKKYEVELKLKPHEAQNIVVGGLLVGQGKMWLDNLEVTVDGKPLVKAPEKKLSKAQKDTEFTDGSNINITNLNDQKIKNLAVLGKAWGLLKYYHTAVADGKYNWDFELFRVMPKVLETKSTSEFNTVLLDWINSYGDIGNCRRCKGTKEDSPIKPDLSWIDKDISDKTLQKKLYNIYDNRYLGKHYYIDFTPNVGNPIFKNENAYTNMTYPDSGFRLLALYRYWNMIQYFFPYKDVIDSDWNSVLADCMPQFINAEDELAYETAMLQLIEKVQDTHANLWGGKDKINDMRGSNYPPFHVRFIEDQLVVTDYYNPELQEEAELNIGDVITTINGKAVEELVEGKLDVYPASNYPTKLRDIAPDLLRSKDSIVDITFSNGKSKKQKLLKLYDRSELDMFNWYRVDEDAPVFKMLDGNIGYVSLANIQEEDPRKISEAFAAAKGVIVDIRNYPSTFVVFSLGQFFSPRGTEFVKFTRANDKNYGEFEMGSPTMVGAGNIAKSKFEGKVVILVNELSQSQAEYTAMSFRASPNATVIGSTTAGADGNVSRINLPGGMSTMISGIGVFYPDGTPTQKVGIVPDIEVKPTVKGIREGRDELIEKAIEHIKSE